MQLEQALSYLQETQRAADHFRSLTAHQRSGFLQIDAATRRSLVSRTLRSGSRGGSLLGVMDLSTSMGSAFLADWIAAPVD